jgi:hypothetical protein
LRWDFGALVIGARAGLIDADGAPLLFTRDFDRIQLPVAVTGAAVPPEQRDITDELERILVDVVVKERTSNVEFFLPGTVETVIEERDGHVDLVHRVTARLDPLTAGAGMALGEGCWDLYVRSQTFGWTRNVRLGSRRTPRTDDHLSPALVGPAPTIVIPYWTKPFDNLSVCVGEAMKTLRGTLRPATDVRIRDYTDATELTATMPLTLGPGVAALPGLVELTDVASKRTTTVPALLGPARPLLRFELPARRPFGRRSAAFGAGLWRMSFHTTVAGAWVVMPIRPVLDARWHRRRPVLRQPGGLAHRIVRALPPNAAATARRLARRVGF